MAPLAAVTGRSRARERMRPRYRGVVAAVVLIPALIAAPWGYVRATTASSVRPASADFAAADAAVVLGARVYEDGRPSRFLRERIEAGVALYHAGTVPLLIMSGDGNDSSGHGEPAVMSRVAQELGVPADAIIEDPHGVDTYASCYRARNVYDAHSVIMVSQEFHVPRAVWVCEQVGLTVQGAYPSPRLTRHTAYGHLREIPAIGKAVLDVLRGRETVTDS